MCQKKNKKKKLKIAHTLTTLSIEFFEVDTSMGVKKLATLTYNPVFTRTEDFMMIKELDIFSQESFENTETLTITNIADSLTGRVYD